MDRAINLFSPGAGTPPPELAGRVSVLNDALIALERVKNGRSEKYGIGGIKRRRQNGFARRNSTISRNVTVSSVADRSSRK